MALCATALRRWLTERGELPDEPLVAFVPVSVRTPEQAGTFGNRVSVMLAELPTDEADPVERLRRVNSTMRAAKERHRRLPASLLEQANHFIPPALFTRAAKATVRVMSLPGIHAPVNVAISNVPGSPHPLYCAGALQRSQYPVSGVLDGLGLNITVVSYRDQLEFGIVADREQLDDPWQLIAALTDALAELRALTNAKSHDIVTVASATEARR
jgi:WS/DGAT/MGAT family acyltransferase